LDIVDGPISVTGSCERFYNSSSFAYLASESSVQKAMTFDVWPAGNTSYQLRVYECKFKGWDVDADSKAPLKEKVEFVGKYYSSSGG
jgi:hypothetical protein